MGYNNDGFNYRRIGQSKGDHQIVLIMLREGYFLV